MENPQKCVVLVSGGMDSCVTSGLAIQQNYTPAFLHVNYGQLTENRERKAFRDITRYYSVNETLEIDLSYFKEIGGSCLTDSSIIVPKANLESNDVPISYVPFRNANLLSIAVSWSEVIGANAIFIGAVEEDSSGYPDCRRSFYDAFEHAIREGTRPGTNLRILTPIIGMSKKEIILVGQKINSPLHLTWSCYKNEELPCGECDSCVLRARGFEQAGIPDPILTVG
ncbi:MAG: 7-cyano-7-deazaguanine synthase QueC [Fidelibacterota bacterium]